MKKVAILQSNYIPWKGYFDMIAAVDEFILYDDTQFTKNDWRNRNLIKTPQGVKWMSVPVGQDIRRRICDVELSPEWQVKHWKILHSNYRRASFFDEVASWLEPLYMMETHTRLSAMNRTFMEAICNYMGIKTRITNCWDYLPVHNQTKTARLVSICEQAGATHYLSGPAAQAYIATEMFDEASIELRWFDYADFPEYPQLWGEFVHGVTILDLLFNCGKDAHRYMRNIKL
jgi:glutaredoxin-related protein